jgi:LPS-assembly protein
MAATLGQIHYFSIPQVTLPGQTPQQAENNDLVGNLSVAAYRNWTVNLGYQWDPNNNTTGKSEFLVQYRPDLAKVVNLAYRYQPDLVQEWDASAAWPISRHWNVVGRWVYSILSKQTIEEVAGIEYRSCCWKIDLVQRRYVNSRNSTGEVNAPGPLNNSIGVEFELIGLSSVAKPGNSFLERSIGGYSPYGPAP